MVALRDSRKRPWCGANVKPSGRFGSVTPVDLIVPSNRWLSAANAPQYGSVGGEGRVVIDATQASFVDPFGLVAIATIVEAARTDGLELDLRLPADPSVRTYLSRMHLRQALDEMGVGCNLGAVNENPLGDRVLELVRFDLHNGVEDLAEKVYNIFEGVDAREAKDLFTSVAEAATNVCDHSGQSGGWAALQQYGNGPGRTVTFAVGDSGVGLRASLVQKYDVPDDVAAIRVAIRRGTTATGEAGRGLGLNAIVETARSHQGKISLWSGRASGSSGPTKDSVYPKAHDHTFQGTIVYATLKYMGGDGA